MFADMYYKYGTLLQNIPVRHLIQPMKMTEEIQRKKRLWWSVFTDVISSRSIVKEIADHRHEVI